MIPKPNLDELLTQVLDEITANAGITNTQKGSISRILTETYLKQIVNLYDYMDQTIKNLSLSTASGIYLDHKGDLLGCDRLNGTEMDTNYRYRISQQPFTIARENLEDLEKSLLEIEGIKKIYLDEYGNGGGSFNVYIFTDEVNISDAVMSNAKNVCKNHKAFGIFAEVRSPEKLYVNMSLLIKPNGTASSSSLKELASKYLKDKIDNVDGNATVNFSQMIEELSSLIGAQKIIVDNIQINNDEIYNFSSYDLNPYSRLVFDDLAVSLIE